MGESSTHKRPRPRGTQVSARIDEARSLLLVLHGPNVGKPIDLFPRCPREGEPPEAALRYVVGSGQGCNLHIPQPEVSPCHAQFLAEGLAIHLQDLGSHLGTYVNEESVAEAVLASGDEIRVGRNLFRFLEGPDPRVLVDAELKRLQTHDTLTGLLNKRYFEQTLEREFQRCERYGRELVVMLAGVDDWDRFHEVLGGLGGDLLARQLGRLIHRSCGRDDTAGRVGADDFAVVLPETDLEAARRQAEALRAAAAELRPVRVTKDARDLPPLHLSVGIASLAEEAEGPTELLRAAHSNLLAARQDGGDQVVG
ncbi:MAG TPA: GGDEF domain-containing protein [Myxococcota bacterium]|nr:GGDEF domain-containing protein [Myxococcota bacterium]HRY95297.1 GGDEF domain-containing protein [Myxococcota bacterium]HSA20878.1 GGDEF domain-containing protein [Myxococcota bacterium]